ncbi:hypothetical protein NM208_g11869 [Fusarium decemcellulare]|uniref:Uncharacterized protein n=1 Tax=Fusarium decemcellulare TaxID=57161 RepID=A0ACC1RQV7_9HYPO|nr:hypothetical protein NM208_g11869 [Fusarium decemcellulare]
MAAPQVHTNYQRLLMSGTRRQRHSHFPVLDNPVKLGLKTRQGVKRVLVPILSMFHFKELSICEFDEVVAGIPPNKMLEMVNVGADRVVAGDAAAVTDPKVALLNPVRAKGMVFGAQD